MQNPCQFGFTQGISPLCAALVTTEILTEADDSKAALQIVLMDTSKAFDVVDHRAMMHHLQHKDTECLLAADK